MALSLGARTGTAEGHRQQSFRRSTPAILALGTTRRQHPARRGGLRLPSCTTGRFLSPKTSLLCSSVTPGGRHGRPTRSSGCYCHLGYSFTERDEPVHSEELPGESIIHYRPRPCPPRRTRRSDRRCSTPHGPGR